MRIRTYTHTHAHICTYTHAHIHIHTCTYQYTIHILLPCIANEQWMIMCLTVRIRSKLHWNYSVLMHCSWNKQLLYPNNIVAAEFILLNATLRKRTQHWFYEAMVLQESDSSYSSNSANNFRHNGTAKYCGFVLLYYSISMKWWGLGTSLTFWLCTLLYTQ